MIRKVSILILLIFLLTACTKYDLGNTTLTKEEKEKVIELLKEEDYINCMPTTNGIDELMNSICSKHKELENVGIQVVW